MLRTQKFKQKEPPEILNLPQHAVGTDLFHWNRSDYLMVVDYYLRYFKIAKLEKHQCKNSDFKSIFARHGIPTKIRCDSGSLYSSVKFQKFAKTWNFQHTTSSLYHQQQMDQQKNMLTLLKPCLTKLKLTKEIHTSLYRLLKYSNKQCKFTCAITHEQTDQGTITGFSETTYFEGPEHPYHTPKDEKHQN